MARSSGGNRAGWGWVGQMLAAIGAGVLVGRYVPDLRGILGWPAVALGLLIIIVAGKR